jgi:hypothetical protein
MNGYSVSVQTSATLGLFLKMSRQILIRASLRPWPCLSRNVCCKRVKYQVLQRVIPRCRSPRKAPKGCAHYALSVGSHAMLDPGRLLVARSEICRTRPTLPRLELERQLCVFKSCLTSPASQSDRATRTRSEADGRLIDRDSGRTGRARSGTKERGGRCLGGLKGGRPRAEKLLPRQWAMAARKAAMSGGAGRQLPKKVACVHWTQPRKRIECLNDP